MVETTEYHLAIFGRNGEDDLTSMVADSGLYQFKVRNVNHPAREYDPSLNFETSDTLLIP